MSGSGSGRPLPIPQAMFNKSGDRGGLYVGGTHVTKTAPARTLFILGAPAQIPTELIENAFRKDFGFVAFRRPRPSMIFVDYKEIGQATVAMRKHQGEKFPGFEHCAGLAIDFDKDPVSKRNMQYEKERDLQLRKSLLVTYQSYCCAFCGTPVFMLAKRGDINLLPRRRTDNAYVVDEAKLLRELKLCGGGKQVIQRPKGLETQYRLNCSKCDLMVAYRPVPIERPSKFIYVADGSVKQSDEWVRDGPPMEDKNLARAVVERTIQKKKLSEPSGTGANAVPLNADAARKRKAAANPPPPPPPPSAGAAKATASSGAAAAAAAAGGVAKLARKDGPP